MHFFLKKLHSLPCDYSKEPVITRDYLAISHPPKQTPQAQSLVSLINVERIENIDVMNLPAPNYPQGLLS